MIRTWALIFIAVSAATTTICRSVYEPAIRAAAKSNEAAGIRDDPPLPEYITGDECLFCHRFNAGQTWQANRHNRTVERVLPDSNPMATLRAEPSTKELADSVEFVLGRRDRVRFLKRGQGYGKLDLLTAELVPERPGVAATLNNATDPQWDSKRFGASCAGCHATQTDSRTKSFSAVSLDCYVCHGNAPLDHANDPRQIPLSRARKDPADVVVSICCQCHLRGGYSISTRLPYPNNYIAGNQLFGDYRVDLALADDPKLSAADRHIYHNAREVIGRGSSNLTCISCHRVHAGSSEKHRRVAQSEICSICHTDRPTSWSRHPYEVHSETCGY